MDILTRLVFMYFYQSHNRKVQERFEIRVFLPPFSHALSFSCLLPNRELLSITPIEGKKIQKFNFKINPKAFLLSQLNSKQDLILPFLPFSNI